MDFIVEIMLKIGSKNEWLQTGVKVQTPCYFCLLFFTCLGTPHKTPFPVFRFFFSLLITGLLLQGLNAQTNTPTTSRQTVQQLSPADAERHKQTTEVEVFARKLTALKTSFAAKDASRIVAYEAYLLRAMQNEIYQLDTITTTASVDASSPSQIRLEKMNTILAAFEGHAFDTAKPDNAARDLSKLDEFFKIMKEALELLKNTKR